MDPRTEALAIDSIAIEKYKISPEYDFAYLATVSVCASNNSI